MANNQAASLRLDQRPANQLDPLVAQEEHAANYRTLDA